MIGLLILAGLALALSVARESWRVTRLQRRVDRIAAIEHVSQPLAGSGRTVSESPVVQGLACGPSTCTVCGDPLKELLFEFDGLMFVAWPICARCLPAESRPRLECEPPTLVRYSPPAEPVTVALASSRCTSCGRLVRPDARLCADCFPMPATDTEGGDS